VGRGDRRLMAVLDVKLPVWQATTKAITPTKAEAKTLEGKGPLVVDGGGLGSEVRILLKNQAKAEQNGLWEVSKNESIGGTGKIGGEGKIGVGESWTLKRTADADSSGEVTEGMLVPVEDGTTNRKTSWIQRTPGPIEVGVTAQTFESLVAGALGAAGGDLTGSYSEPTIAEAVIDNSNVASSAAIKASKLDLKEQVASTDLASSSKQLFLQLAGISGLKATFGEAICEFDGVNKMSKATTVKHGLPTAPRWIGAFVFGSGSWAGKEHPWVCSPSKSGETELALRLYPVDAGPYALGNSVPVTWMAIG
jgi:hypothetical protein